MNANKILTVIFFIFLNEILGKRIDFLTIKTDTGFVRGKISPGKCGVKKSWLGIPYAEPPLNKLRFKPPQPIQPWTDVFDATKQPNACMQTSASNEVGLNLEAIVVKNMSEDCLYLNVVTPLYSNEYLRLPVIVWIHGGAFDAGSIALPIYDPECIVLFGNVIVVAINYRLNSFGFLRIDDNTAAGNMGLLDQQMAMNWVKRNIKLFGGDPNKITLLGQSAGSASVSLHLVSPGSQGLFQNVIMQSGTALSNWGFEDPDKASQNSQALAQKTGCPLDDNQKLLECLQDKPPKSLLLEAGTGIMPTFSPTLDGKFINDTLENLFERSNFTGLSAIIGNTKDEGDFYAWLLLSTKFGIQMSQIPDAVTKEQAISVISESLNMTGLNTNLAPMLLNLYLESNYFKAVAQMITDYSFICPTNNIAKILKSKGAQVYQYVFAYPTKFTPWRNHLGVVHGEDLIYSFGIPFTKSVPLPFLPNESTLSLQTILRFSQHARTGQPDIMWRPYMEDIKEYALFDNLIPIMKKNNREIYCSYMESVK